MSASLQYSNYAGQADFAVPYEILTAPKAIQEMYLESCKSDMDCYEELCAAGIGHDAAGYVTPQECADYQRNTLPVETYHRPAGMPAQYGRDPDRAPENLAGAFFIEPGTLCSRSYRPFLPERSMSGGENELQKKDRGQHDARRDFGGGLPAAYGRRRP